MIIFNYKYAHTHTRRWRIMMSLTSISYCRVMIFKGWKNITVVPSNSKGLNAVYKAPDNVNIHTAFPIHKIQSIILKKQNTKPFLPSGLMNMPAIFFTAQTTLTILLWKNSIKLSISVSYNKASKLQRTKRVKIFISIPFMKE